MTVIEQRTGAGYVEEEMIWDWFVIAYICIKPT